ncbi:MAG: aminotransferase class V-fold PLP-dependent enzyme [Thiogranum sp.]
MTDDEFALSPDICYLNHAAVAPWPRRTVEAVQRFAQDNGEYGAKHYERWLGVEKALRGQLRELVNARGTDEIALLKNTSEALSVVAWGMAWNPGDEIIISDQEFPSNRIAWESLKSLGVTVVEVDIGATDTPETAIVERMTERTRLVSLSSVQYSSGLAMDLVPIGQACRQRGIAFCVDAIQSLGARPFDVQECQADFAMADGHKWMLGPEGVALFYCRREWLDQLSLRQYGWHMVEAAGDYDARNWQPAGDARRFECGSPNMLGIHALHASLGLLLETGIPDVFRVLSGKISYLIDLLDATGAVIVSERNPQRRAGIVTFKYPGVDTDTLYRKLQQQGVVCALRGGGIRFAPHFYTPRSVLRRAVSLVEACA